MSATILNNPSTVSKPETFISKPDATFPKPSFGGQVAGSVPPLQVDDLLDFQFPLKTSIREAHVQKWTNPSTGQLYNWQQPYQPAPTGQASKGVDLDQILDWKYTKGKGLEAPNSMSAAQAKQMKRTAAPYMSLPFDLYPPNYQMQVTNEAPVVTNVSNANGIIENYIDQYEVFKN